MSRFLYTKKRGMEYKHNVISVVYRRRNRFDAAQSVPACGWIQTKTSQKISLQLKQFPQGPDVSLSHLKSLEFTQLSVVAQVRNVFSEALESIVEAVHPFALSGVGRATSLHTDIRGKIFVVLPRLSLVSRAAVVFVPGKVVLFPVARIEKVSRRLGLGLRLLPLGRLAGLGRLLHGAGAGRGHAGRGGRRGRGWGQGRGGGGRRWGLEGAIAWKKERKKIY